MELLNQLQGCGDVLCDVPLSKHTTFRIGGKCKYFVYPKNELNIYRILALAQAYCLPVRVFGKGSNLLCSDADYEGIIICLDRYFCDYSFAEDGMLYAQAGTSLVMLAKEAMKRSFSGLEFASGIPATLGGALFMNAGAYKAQMSDIVKSVYVLKTDHCEWMPTSTLDYGYRCSIFQDHRDWIIMGAQMKLALADRQQIQELMDSRRQRRLASQPLNKPSAGSVFRNPEAMPAWQMIENVGYRGKRIGGALVSEKHANFIVNEDHATAKDVNTLIEEIQAAVYEKYGIRLKMEVEKFNWNDSI